MISGRAIRSLGPELPSGGSLERRLPRGRESSRKRRFRSPEFVITQVREGLHQECSPSSFHPSSTNTSDRPAPHHQKHKPKEETGFCPLISSKMAFEVFQGFYAKVHQILGFSEPQVVIPALVSLADGDRATVPGAIIEPLSGLGEQNPMPSDNEPYRAAMRELLEWGLRHFPIRTRSRGVRLWSTMAIFDGHRGYNQK